MLRMVIPSPELDEQFIRRAIRLAMNGRGRVEPNPMVGCVIVKDGRVIGEGHTQPPGGPHAEPTALANCTESPAGATAYVTLEPCCHTNKRTPPCAPRLIEARIARVVYGCLDPNPPVNGNGVAMLRAAGIQVNGPVLEGAAKQLIEPFIRQIAGASPHITLKWAETADGKVAGPGGQRIQISDREASALVHQLRARCDGILVGIGTVLGDDPLLTPRDVELRHKPTRIVLDRRLRLPLTSRLVQTAKEWPTVAIYNGFDGHSNSQPLKRRGVAVYGHDVTGTDDQEELRIAIDGVIRDKLHLRELLVEPGPTLAREFFATRRVDRLWVIRSAIRVNDCTAPTAAPIPEWLVRTGTLRVGADELTEYRQPMFDDASDCALPPVPSADFVLAREAGATSSRP